MSDDFQSETERRLVRGVQRWGLILRALGLLDDDSEAEYLNRPWKKVGERYGIHAAWLKAGKPRAPGERGHDTASWEHFLRSIGRS